MEDRRKDPRLQEENDVTITVLSGSKHQKVIYDISKDISVSGARIHSQVPLPVDSLLRIDIMLESMQKLITVLAKVKWIKIIYQDEDYEAGVEFVNTPDEAIKKIDDYISLKLSTEK
jgi:c-di-GMP-binding flagellar brake protein YcgR